MGNACKEQGKLEEAVEALNKALSIKPDNAEAYSNMGVALKGSISRAIPRTIKKNTMHKQLSMGLTLQNHQVVERGCL